MGALFRFSLSALFLLVGSAVGSAGEPSAIPKHFIARIGGFLGSSYSVELKDGAITYTSSSRGKTNARHAITPTEAQWREFRRTLDELKVWTWRDDYPRGGVVDGTQWMLDIAYDNHLLKTRGDNNYPDVDGKPTGKPEFTAAFDCFLAAVKRLIGGKEFG